LPELRVTPSIFVFFAMFGLVIFARDPLSHFWDVVAARLG